MKLQKWSYQKHKYSDYEIPDSWKCPIYSDNMDQVINCTSCGKLLRYGNCYTSLEIHNRHGFGYPVCQECYKEEWNRRRKEK